MDNEFWGGNPDMMRSAATLNTQGWLQRFERVNRGHKRIVSRCVVNLAPSLNRQQSSIAARRLGFREPNDGQRGIRKHCGIWRRTTMRART